MKKILPPSDPRIFRGSAILTGASLGTLTAMALSFQYGSAFQMDMSSRSESSIIREVASVSTATSTSPVDITFVTKPLSSVQVSAGATSATSNASRAAQVSPAPLASIPSSLTSESPFGLSVKSPSGLSVVLPAVAPFVR